MEGHIYREVFTRKIIETVLSPNFKFPVRRKKVTGDNIFRPDDFYFLEDPESTEIDGYLVHPFKNKERQILIDYKNLFDRNPILGTIIRGTSQSQFGIEEKPLIFELYILSNGFMELLILNTPMSKTLLDKYGFLYTHRLKPYKGERYGSSYIFNASEFHKVVPKSSTPEMEIDYLYVTGLKTIDDVFLDKIMGRSLIFGIRLPAKNLSDLIDRPPFYIKEYFTKYLKEFPEFLRISESHLELFELNHEIANMYIERITDASEEDLKKFYYYLAQIILHKEERLNEDEYEAIFDYFLEADDYLDAKSLREEFFFSRLGFPPKTTFGFDINLDIKTLFNLGRTIKELIDKCK